MSYNNLSCFVPIKPQNKNFLAKKHIFYHIYIYTYIYIYIYILNPKLAMFFSSTIKKITNTNKNTKEKVLLIYYDNFY